MLREHRLTNVRLIGPRAEEEVTRMMAEQLADCVRQGARIAGRRDARIVLQFEE